MTGTRDVTTCADIVYKKYFRTQFHRLTSFLQKKIFWVPVPGRMHVTQERYTLSRFWLHRCVEWIAHYTMVPISWNLKLEPSDRFSQTRSHNYYYVTRSRKRGPFPKKSDCELDLSADSTKTVVHARENRLTLARSVPKLQSFEYHIRAYLGFEILAFISVL